MLGGNNEDYFNPLTKVWFVPGDAGAYGRVYFGYDNYFPQGGMNDQGLFFDGLAVDTPLAVPIEGKRPFTGTILLDYVMAHCATAACAAEMFETYYAQETWSWQHFFGDATGESAIVEPQAVLRQRGGCQVATNFYQSTVPPEERASACWRYETATRMRASSPPLSVETIRDVMAAVHVEGRHGSATLYTNVYDLVNRVVYLYYFFDYEHVVVIDLEEELAQGAHAYDLPALFPPNPAAEAFARPVLAHRDSLIQARRAEVDPAFLAAYAGEYEVPAEWGTPDDVIHVVPHGGSLMMVYPDAHRYELFPQGETSFFVLTWRDTRFQALFDVNFGVDAAGRVLHLEIVADGDVFARHDRLGPASFVPYVPTPVPPATAPPTPAAATVTPAPTTAATAATLPLVEPAPAPGFPWGWLIVPAALLAAAAGWWALRRRRAGRRHRT
jgi:hypothetical protein